MFTGYEKIAESPEEWHIDEAAYRLLAKEPWVVTEKIHGANFCFLTDGQIVLCANRKHILSSTDDFFHYQIVLEKLQQKVLRAFLAAKKRFPQISQLFLYGELYGGYYPHPDVRPDPSVQPVQTGIWYAPSIEFCAFDLALEAAAPGAPRSYVDYDIAMSIFEEVGIFYATPLFTGSYQEALAYPLGFDSTIPRRLGLPPLAEPNKAEGVVIKPLKTLLVESSKGAIRPILKKKIPEFAEDKRFSQAEKWATPPPGALPGNLDLLIWEAFNLVTENRLHSVLSKVGALHTGDGRREQYVFRLFVEDVLERLEATQSEALAVLRNDERLRLMDALHGEVRMLLKQHSRA
jgi:Rnl2 family RNA ligase